LIKLNAYIYIAGSAKCLIDLLHAKSTTLENLSAQEHQIFKLMAK